MRSVKDSFDSELESVSDAAREGTAGTAKKTRAQRNSIPKGAATGFKKASELLQATEASKLSSDAGVHGLNDLNLEETRRLGNEAAGSTKFKRRASAPRSRRKKDISQIAEDVTLAPSKNTSPYFPLAGQVKDHGQDVPTAALNQAQESKSVQERADYEIAPVNPLGYDNRTHDQDLMSEASKAEGLLHDVNNNAQSSSVGIINPMSTREDIISPAKRDAKAERAASGNGHRLPEDSLVLSTTSIMARSSEREGIIDLTAESDLNFTENGAATMANIVAKYSHQAQNSIANAGSTSKPEPVLTTSKDKNPSMAPPALKQRISPVKNKSPAKKKALTLTEKALDDFRTEEIGDSLLLPEYFPTIIPDVPVVETESAAQPRSRAKQSRKTRTLQKRSSLIAPSEALRSLHDQHLVFGTSSQLMQHSSSPIYEQDRRNQPATAPGLSCNESFVDIDTLLGASPGLLVLKSTRSLWSAAHRDDDGSLVGADLAEPLLAQNNPPDEEEIIDAIVDISDSPEQPDHNPDGDEMTAAAAPAQDSVVGDTSIPLLPATSMPTDQVPTIVKAIPALARSLGEAATIQRQKSRSPVKKKRKVKDTSDKPDDPFKKVPLDDLKAELRGFGCKIPRSRAKMGELILECRAKQNELQKGAQHQLVPDQELLPVGLPSVQDIDSVAAETNAIKSPPSKRKRAQDKSSSSSDDLPPPSFQAPTNQNQQDQAHSSELLAGIHQAIMAQLPTHSIQNPSWREKIAMYDPIVLEELTAWLNGGGLDAVGFDGEAWPAIVRDYCESKSVCFIWATGGWRKKRQK